MSKMTRPVMKHLAKMNFKNWDRIDKILKRADSRLDELDINDHNAYVFVLNLIERLGELKKNIIFIDESFRIWLEED